ncbi:MAG: Gfo/Idh/MocA family oxidoreductase [Spirochaetaceae bacterium]|nr:Gfo/Idh/MocA family oxidoreductase [Spirochaetaceae bacterium]
MKLLMVGLGSMGCYHMKKFTNLGMQIVGGVDPDIEKQNNAKKLYNIPWVGEKIEDFPFKMDAISIAVPDSLHKECYLKAITFNKPLFLEKPLSCNLVDALELEEKIGDNCIINYSKRNVIALFELKEILEQKILGKIKKVNIDYNQDWLTKEAKVEWMENDRFLWRLSPIYSAGGCIADLGSHLLDCLFILFNTVEFKETVFERTFKEELEDGLINYKSTKENKYHLLDYISGKPKIYVDYRANYLIDSNIPCSFSCSFLSKKYSEAMIIRIIGENGEAFIDSSKDRNNVSLKIDEGFEKIKGSAIVPTYTQFKNFVEKKTQHDLPTIHRAVEIQQILQEVLFCQ